MSATGTKMQLVRAPDHPQRKIDRIVAADRALNEHLAHCKPCTYVSQRDQCATFRRLDAACDEARK